jgi:hypothetical protein
MQLDLKLRHMPATSSHTACGNALKHSMTKHLPLNKNSHYQGLLHHSVKPYLLIHKSGLLTWNVAAPHTGRMHVSMTTQLRFVNSMISQYRSIWGANMVFNGNSISHAPY